ncbi:hypothetical protein [Inquilinus limosus]|uniref:hypothetical protein n=1 Tax=Inquilinus limosus TaxID=171674 RepID=UPI0003F86F19|nr:hypothetical protein [Inquilinus limosus]
MAAQERGSLSEAAVLQALDRFASGLAKRGRDVPRQSVRLRVPVNMVSLDQGFSDTVKLVSHVMVL